MLTAFWGSKVLFKTTSAYDGGSRKEGREEGAVASERSRLSISSLTAGDFEAKKPVSGSIIDKREEM